MIRNFCNAGGTDKFPNCFFLMTTKWKKSNICGTPNKNCICNDNSDTDSNTSCNGVADWV
jgi:hypothetical protein